MADHYEIVANQARNKILDMIFKAQTSHIGSNFSCVDILTVLYGIANITDEFTEDRDRIVLSKGWAAAAAYYFLARKGVIPEADLETYCMPESKYIGLAEPYVRGIEAAGGAMGHGLPMAVGMALAAQRAEVPWKTYVLMSDGEMDCGTTWESALIANHHRLGNLTVIVDYNKWQAIGRTNEVLRLEPFREKWEAFGFETREVDGHNFNELERAFTYPPLYLDRPKVVIAHTVKGKGVSFMEDKLEWHYRNVDKESYEKAKAELNA